MLWEEESRRVVAEPATIYTDFDDEDLWASSVATAQGHGTILNVVAEGPLRHRALVIRRSGECDCDCGWVWIWMSW